MVTIGNGQNDLGWHIIHALFDGLRDKAEILEYSNDPGVFTLRWNTGPRHTTSCDVTKVPGGWRCNCGCGRILQ